MFDALTAAAPPGFALAVAMVAVALMLLEYLAAKLAHIDSHDPAETAASLFIGVFGNLVKKAMMAVVAIPYMLVYEHRLFDIPLDSALAALGLFLGVEFFYYWMHRCSHTVRWMWATHRVHHSPTRLNFTAAVRLGWTGPISGAPLFFLPMVWLGFHPLAVIGALGANLAYQFFLHTERQVHLGPLEWVLNTPRHHQAHHASNDRCLDANYGGVLIVYDRLFGTFVEAPRNEPLSFGLKGEAPTSNPLRILFSEWGRLFSDLAASRSLREAWLAAFGAPGAFAAHRTRSFAAREQRRRPTRTTGRASQRASKA